MIVLAVGAFAIGMVLAGPAPAPAVVGDWNGALSTGSDSLKVVIHVSQDKDGKLTATMDSPDQGAIGIVISSISYQEPTLRFGIEKLGASYEGSVSKDHSEIAGNWKQSGASLPLSFKRVTH